MGLRDVLLGKKKLAGPARERLFALTTAAVTLDAELGLRSAGAGGIVFKPLSAGEFVRAENDLQQLLDSVAGESGSKLERRVSREGKYRPSRSQRSDPQVCLTAVPLPNCCSPTKPAQLQLICRREAGLPCSSMRASNC